MRNKKKIIVAATGLPVRKGPEYLLSRRHAPGTKAWHNKWQVVGGSLEFGETLEQALVREFQEELSVTPKIIFPLPIVKTSIWYAQETSKTYDVQIVLTTYLVDIGSQKIDLSKDDETNKVDWFTLSQVNKIQYLPATLEIVKEAENIISISDQFLYLR